MVDVKEKIFEKLKSIDNEDFLNSILLFIQNIDDEGVFHLSDQQKSDIDESISQIAKGEYSTHREVMQKYTL